MFELHDQGTQRVSVSSDQNRLALLHKRENVLAEVREHTVGRELKRLTTRRGYVKRAAPDVHLLVTPLLTGAVLVETGELAVVALIQGLVLGDRDAFLADLLKLDLKRLLRTLEVRSESLAAPVSVFVALPPHTYSNFVCTQTRHRTQPSVVSTCPLTLHSTHVAVLLQLTGALERLLLTKLRQGRVLPASELDQVSTSPATANAPGSACSTRTDRGG